MRKRNDAWWVLALAAGILAIFLTISTLRVERAQPFALPDTRPGGDFSIDINHADALQLDQLPGIGPSLAQAIIDARPFDTLEQLRDVPGIGSATYGALAAFISLGDADSSE